MKPVLCVIAIKTGEIKTGEIKARRQRQPDIAGAAS
jgi:hypothetical protein